ncbi:uncharacterized protein LOC120694229 [Panicum virgatum]|uniref:uncharacterized protein LOC120694229 n=1 Tax=Panicum virgatum TaxID=38727 RepID=UPI0019D555B7|nr:uncharacterized protein LOC120694229 [Panicum virgatum]
MDSLRKDSDLYKDMTDMLKKVWKRFIRKHSDNFSAELKLKTNFPCRRQAHENNLCVYYIIENIHSLVGHQKAYSIWQEELYAMRETLIPEERVLAIQEAMCGFIVQEVLDKTREFYYDGMSNIDNRSKYDNIE